jgi:hypothetical protein
MARVAAHRHTKKRELNNMIGEAYRLSKQITPKRHFTVCCETNDQNTTL